MALQDDAGVRNSSRIVPLDGGINFRDLGGYVSRDGRHVKWGKLFRCGHLAELSDEDLVSLRALGIHRVHDFRREEEQRRMPSREFSAQTTADYQISIGSMSRFWDILLAGKLTALSSHELVVNSYRDCIEEVIPAYTRFMRGILDNDRGGSLFHCAAGKDRTGMAAALILGALDVPRETIVEDYLLTLEHFDSENLLRLVEQHLRDADVEHWQRDWLTPYCSVHRDNIEAFLDALDRNYGSIGNYLQSALGFNADDCASMRAQFLTD